ncbi:MAG: hypothetical protein M1812_003223 [Candelaria pacifica]|nr:MAG: hypothetical protein M1812_003223 [Candelaria pacifica]
MGSVPSKESKQQQLNEKLPERNLAQQLQALHVDKDEPTDEGFVQVNSGSYCSPTLSISATQAWEKKLLEDPKNRLALSALTSNSPNTVLTSRNTKIADTQTFNIKIPLEGYPVTNQRASGRCWLFAATNVFRVAIMRRHNLKEFELSQAYLFYWDKLEKANFFLEQVLDTMDEDMEGRLMQALLSSPVGDGGQWDMVANLVNKYGLVPQSVYPDSYNAMNSRYMDALVTTKLREDALKLRTLAGSSATPQSSLAGVKEKMLREIHLMLTLMLGPPPSLDSDFVWEYYDKNDVLHSVTTTPLKFAKELSSSQSVRACGGTDVHELFSLVNDPRNSYNTLLSVKRLGNVFEGRSVGYVNVDMDTMKTACVAMLRRGLPIFFGSDVGKYLDGAAGIMDLDIIDYSLAFNISLNMSKGQRIVTGESSMTHAMVLTAVHVVDGKPVRWRVQNSWGEAAGDKGWFVMSDKWMDQFVYQAVVDPEFVSKEVRDVLKQNPKMLELWDPMGALA